MLLTVLSIVGYWVSLGTCLGLLMFVCLQFANLCGYIVDFVVTKK
jgi:hypothetical protein